MLYLVLHFGGLERSQQNQNFIVLGFGHNSIPQKWDLFRFTYTNIITISLACFIFSRIALLSGHILFKVFLEHQAGSLHVLRKIMITIIHKAIMNWKERGNFKMYLAQKVSKFLQECGQFLTLKFSTNLENLRWPCNNDYHIQYQKLITWMVV